MKKKSKLNQEPAHDHSAPKSVPCDCGENCPCRNKERARDKRLRKKQLILILLFFSSASIVVAQDAKESFWDDPFSSPMLPYYIILFFMVVIIMLIIAVGSSIVKILNLFARQAEAARAAKAGVEVARKVSWFQKIWDEFNASVPVTQEEKIDLGHNFDGIRELDNHLPPWWKGLFYGSILWAVVYLIVYHVTSNLPLSGQEYDNELTLAAEKARLYQASRPAEQIDMASIVYDGNPETVGKGKAVFLSSNCGSCHRADGGGNNIGPNLTDEYWLHGGSIQNVFSTINKGVVDKGMPAWGKAMSPADVRNVAFYILSLQGSKPENPKAPQGEKFVPETKPAPGDSTKIDKSGGTE